MSAGSDLPRSFYSRPAHVVARDLLGRDLLGVTRGGTRIRARIVETEAYGPDDPASHGYRGPTRRNASMFGPPGHLYVYFTYGIHWCVNVVTGSRGEGSAVLLRAAVPLEGTSSMARRRGVRDPARLCSGPANLARAFGIDGNADGADLLRGPWRLLVGEEAPSRGVVRGPRVGISRAREVPWRFRYRPPLD